MEVKWRSTTKIKDFFGIIREIVRRGQKGNTDIYSTKEGSHTLDFNDYHQERYSSETLKLQKHMKQVTQVSRRLRKFVRTFQLQ